MSTLTWLRSTNVAADTRLEAYDIKFELNSARGLKPSVLYTYSPLYLLQ